MFPSRIRLQSQLLGRVVLLTPVNKESSVVRDTPHTGCPNLQSFFLSLFARMADTEVSGTGEGRRLGLPRM